MIALALSILIAAAAPASLEAGRRAFEEAAFERCLTQLEDAARQTRDRATLSKIHLLRGRCFSALQQFGAAEAAFTEALRNDPEARLDPVDVFPSVVSLLDSVRGRSRGTLSVTLRPPQRGTVMVDGEDKKTASLQIQLPIGKHRVAARTLPSGAEVAGREVLIRLGETEQVVLEVADPEPPAPQWTLSGRAMLDPLAGFGFELGPGLGGRHWHVEATLTIGGALAAGVRAGLLAPRLLGPFGLRASLDGRLFFLQRVAPTLGASAGVSLSALSWLDFFVEASVAWAFDAVDYRPGYVLAAGGLRLIAP